jgi:hypothetical protein
VTSLGKAASRAATVSCEGVRGQMFELRSYGPPYPATLVEGRSATN